MSEGRGHSWARLTPSPHRYGAELALMLSVTRRLPPIKGAGRVGNVLRRVYNRKPREPIEAEVVGFRMKLDAAETVDGAILFCPQLYDHTEISYLRASLHPGDCFVDVGAHIGLYSLIASGLVGADGRIIAIEADPYNFARLRVNLELNGVTNIDALCRGVSDRREILRLGINTTGNRGGNSFLKEGRAGTMVDCVPLLETLLHHNSREIGGLKLDIEGFEFRVLKQFFSDADRSLYPRFIITEYFPEWVGRAGGDTLALLVSRGYRLRRRTRFNSILELSESTAPSATRSQTKERSC
jgi:FkbM family methyltransferase